MDRIAAARDILKALGLPPAQQNEMSALTLLALCRLGPDDAWHIAQRQGSTITKDVMAFVAQAYQREYAPNTRETFRRQVLHQVVQAGIADYNPFQPDLPTNSPRAHYAVTEDALAAVRAYGTTDWDNAVKRFIEKRGSLATRYAGRRSERVPVQLPDGVTLDLSPGKHNRLQAAVIEAFIPRFASGARVLYLGDTAEKALYLHTEALAALNVTVTEHDKLPDLILHDAVRERLLLIEVVTSHGPMTPKRVLELQAYFAACSIPLIYVTAFQDFKTFRRHAAAIAWETEVWIAEIPDHMIHFNGDQFF